MGFSEGEAGLAAEGAGFRAGGAGSKTEVAAGGAGLRTVAFQRSGRD